MSDLMRYLNVRRKCGEVTSQGDQVCAVGRKRRHQRVTHWSQAVILDRTKDGSKAASGVAPSMGLFEQLPKPIEGFTQLAYQERSNLANSLGFAA
jgi:hypothetical protein